MNKKNTVQSVLIILLLVYVFYWIWNNLAQEKKLIEFCQQLHSSMQLQQVVVQAQQLNLRQYKSADGLMLVANKTLPETPSCHITFKYQQIISADLVIPRQSKSISLIKAIDQSKL